MSAADHPTKDCYVFMREQLRNEVAEFDIVLAGDWPHIKRGYRAATRDSGAKFPSKREIRRENWGRWHDALAEQIENASNGQIAAYYAERFRDRGCPACWGDS